MTELTKMQWDTISAELRAAFPPEHVKFRIQSKSDGGKATVVAYLDARAVQDRLDDVVGTGNWSFDWQPLVIDKNTVLIAKGTVSIYGVSKSDAGKASNQEGSLGVVSHCFKRAAVQWGIGRYLYGLPPFFVDGLGDAKFLPREKVRELRAKLPRPGGMARPVQEEATTETQRGERLPAEGMATPQQIAAIDKLCDTFGKPRPDTGEMTYTQARELLSQLSGEFQRARRANDEPVQSQQDNVTPIRSTAPARTLGQVPQPRQRQSQAVADLAAQTVPADQQTALCVKLYDMLGCKDKDAEDAAATITVWVAKQIRPAGGPRGTISAPELKAGSSNITMAELSVALEAVEREKERRQHNNTVAAQQSGTGMTGRPVPAVEF